MQTVAQILEELEQTPGSKAKLAILKANSDNQLLCRVFALTYDPYIVFYVNKITFKKSGRLRAPSDDAEVHYHDRQLRHFLNDLENRLATREVTGNAAKALVIEDLNVMDELEQKWGLRVLLRNLRCGVNEGTINKVWPDLIKPFECQLAVTLKSTFIKGEGIKLLETVNYPVQVEPKLDGLRMLAIKTDEVKLYTRNGSPIDELPKIKEFLEKHMPENTVFDGESMGESWNESSSVMNSSKNKKDDSGMIFHGFDSMSIDEWRLKGITKDFYARRQDLVEMISRMPEGPVRPVDAIIANNDNDLLTYFANCMDRGFEGVMLKNIKAQYQWDRTRDVLKLKPFVTYEGVIIDYFLGRTGTKREGLFAGFIVLLPNGVTTRVGSGMKDTFKAEVQLKGPESYKGLIIECKAQPDPLTLDGLSKDGRMRFPSFVRFRDRNDVDPKVYAAWVNYKLSRPV